jgi:hypothetical protein
LETTNPLRVKLFYDKIDKDGPLFRPTSLYPETNLGKCWIWKGAKDQKGYPNFVVEKGKVKKAHRFSFLLAYGWILPHPYQIEHKCRTTSCVNPKHLVLLRGATNNERSNSASAINKRKTKCKYGHLFSEENTLRKNGRRYCIICEKEKGRIL